MRIKIFIYLIFVIFANLSSLQSYAGLQCGSIFLGKSSILEKIEKSSLTYGIISGPQVGNKSLPVVLVNFQALGKDLSDILSHTLGVVVAHQKNYRNDHGLLRLDSYFIDRDLPGARNRGEINQTGISFISVPEYLAYSNYSKSIYNRVEVLFDLTEKQFETSVLYHKMRRASIVRPDFNFGVNRNVDAENRLVDCGEICFSFSTGSSVASQIRSIENVFQKHGFFQAEALLKNADVKNFMKIVKTRIFNSALDEKSLNPKMFDDLEVPASLGEMKKLVVPGYNFINLLIGFEISKDYSTLLKELEINNSSSFSNVMSSKASAVLIYDANVSPEDFLKPEYKSQGVFSTWSHTGIVAPQVK